MTINNTSKEYLEKLIADLVIVGEDEEDLSMWIDVYDAMSEEERIKLFENLEKELRDLKSLQ